MTRTPTILLALAAAAPAALGQSQIIELAYDAPTLDRWNYPFNGSPGSRLSAPTFGAPELEGFDDHDAQFVLGFETGGDVQAGLDLSDYQVLGVTVTIANSNGGEFRYDPSYDSHDTYLFLDDSLDADPGRPVHLWAAGYRNGFTVDTWGEFTAFGGTPVVEPAQGARHLFAAYFPMPGSGAVDISNNIKEGFDAAPMAVGTTDAVLPGEFVPADTSFSFDVDLCRTGVRDYLAGGLSDGEMRFVVTSLHQATGGDGGGTGDVTYPAWYTKENPIAQILDLTATLELRVRIGSPGDYNADGSFNFFDVSGFLSDFNSANLDADLNGDCVLNFFDVSAFLQAFNAG